MRENEKKKEEKGEKEEKKEQRRRGKMRPKDNVNAVKHQYLGNLGEGYCAVKNLVLPKERNCLCLQLHGGTLLTGVSLFRAGGGCTKKGQPCHLGWGLQVIWYQSISNNHVGNQLIVPTHRCHNKILDTKT